MTNGLPGKLLVFFAGLICASLPVNRRLHLVGVINDSLLARIDPDIYQSSLRKKGCRPMDFTGRIMKGFVCVDPTGIDSDRDLAYWIQVCLDFNPKAKASKKRAAGKTNSAPKKLKRSK